MWYYLAAGLNPQKKKQREQYKFSERGKENSINAVHLLYAVRKTGLPRLPNRKWAIPVLFKKIGTCSFGCCQKWPLLKNIRKKKLTDIANQWRDWCTSLSSHKYFPCDHYHRKKNKSNQITAASNKDQIFTTFDHYLFFENEFLILKQHHHS